MAGKSGPNPYATTLYLRITKLLTMAPERDLKTVAFSRVLDLPELNVALFAFFLNFVWEFWQISWFADIATASHLEGVKICTRATFGDVGIAVVAFWAVSLSEGTRSWTINPSRSNVISFILVGVVITVLFEWLATGVLNRWAYVESMPTLPFLGTGLLPLVQWIVIPPLILWFVRRQLSQRPQVD